MRRIHRTGILGLATALALALSLSGCGSPYASDAPQTTAATTSSAAAHTVASTSDASLYDVSRYMSADAKGPEGPSVAEHDVVAGKVTVAVTVDTTGVDGTVMRTENPVVLDEGATAYDALVAVMGPDAVNAQDSQYGLFVSAIGGIAQMEHGNASSWMYDVNGVMGSVACDQYVLADGDSLVWFYVTGDL